MTFEFIHPDFSYPEGISPHVGSEVLCVGLVGSLDVGNPRAGQDLHTPATLPYPDPKLHILPSIDLHAFVQQANLLEVLPVHNETANEGGAPDWGCGVLQLPPGLGWVQVAAPQLPVEALGSQWVFFYLKVVIFDVIKRW